MTITETDVFRWSTRIYLLWKKKKNHLPLHPKVEICPVLAFSSSKDFVYTQRASGPLAPEQSISRPSPEVNVHIKFGVPLQQALLILFHQAVLTNGPNCLSFFMFIPKQTALPYHRVPCQAQEEKNKHKWQLTTYCAWHSPPSHLMIFKGPMSPTLALRSRPERAIITLQTQHIHDGMLNLFICVKKKKKVLIQVTFQLWVCMKEKLSKCTWRKDMPTGQAMDTRPELKC